MWFLWVIFPPFTQLALVETQSADLSESPVLIFFHHLTADADADGTDITPLMLSSFSDFSIRCSWQSVKWRHF